MVKRLFAATTALGLFVFSLTAVSQETTRNFEEVIEQAVSVFKSAKETIDTVTSAYEAYLIAEEQAAADAAPAAPPSGIDAILSAAPSPPVTPTAPPKQVVTTPPTAPPVAPPKQVAATPPITPPSTPSVVAPPKQVAATPPTPKPPKTEPAKKTDSVAVSAPSTPTQPTAQETLTVNVRRDPIVGGTVTRSPRQVKYAAGTEITITATADEEYKFTHWDGTPPGVDETSPSITFKVTYDIELTANFELQTTHRLNVKRNIAVGGTVTQSPMLTKYITGTPVTVTATESDGYKFSNWTGAPKDADSSSKNITFNITADMELTANFHNDSTYTLSINTEPADGGTVAYSPTQTNYASFTRVTVRAIPTPAYRFVGWSGASTSTEPNLMVVMTGNLTLTANFEFVSEGASVVNTVQAEAAPVAPAAPQNEAVPDTSKPVQTSDQSADKSGGGVDIEMVRVKGGTFTMGCSVPGKKACDSDERPPHSVSLNDFYIGKYEVTQKQWVHVMGRNPSKFRGGDLPVESVSWEDIQVFIETLNSKTGKNYRLPTEAEWEFAALGGVHGSEFAGSRNLNEVAWHIGNSGKRTWPVGTMQPNGYGIYDMSGNVAEWTADWYGKYSSVRKSNPRGMPTGTHRVIRGGSWGDVQRNCRISDREKYFPNSSQSGLGFRLTLDAER